MESFIFEKLMYKIIYPLPKITKLESLRKLVNFHSDV